MARHPDESGCVNCSKKLTHAHGERKPPCVEGHQYANSHGKTTLMVFDASLIGSGPCPWHAEWQELHPLLLNRNYLLHNPADLQNGYGAGLASNALIALAERAKSHLIGSDSRDARKNEKDLDYISKNGQRVYAISPSMDLLILIAKPHDHDWDKFNDEYKHKITNHGHYDRNVKYLLAIQEAAQLTPGEMGKFLKELTQGHNLARSILIFSLFAAGTAVAISAGGVARALAVIVGLGMDAAMFASCAGKLIAFGTQIEKAETPEAITAAAHRLYEFCSELSALLIPQAAGMAAGAAVALRQRIASKLESWFVSSRARWKQASSAEMKATHQVAHPAPVPHSHPPKASNHEGVSPTSFSGLKRREPNAQESAAGLWTWHLEGWQNWARKHRSLAVVRAGNPKSLPRHFDIMVDGKPMLVKWKTAKEGEWAGLVVVPDRNAKGELLRGLEKLELHECIVKLKKAGYTFKPPPKSPSGMPEPGALVINEKGQALCGDVDAMGVYALNGEGKCVAANTESYNNSKLLQKDLNTNTYGVNSPTMGQHPGQDFFYYATDKYGNHTMGLQPGLDEKFVVFTPDGKHDVVNLTQLEAIYRKHGIPWKYDAGIANRQADRLKELRDKHKPQQ